VKFHTRCKREDQVGVKKGRTKRKNRRVGNEAGKNSGERKQGFPKYIKPIRRGNKKKKIASYNVGKKVLEVHVDREGSGQKVSRRGGRLKLRRKFSVERGRSSRDGDRVGSPAFEN